jgi:multidrug efflux system membrane fusion protein
MTDQSVMTCLPDFLPHSFNSDADMLRIITWTALAIAVVLTAGCQQQTKKSEPPPPMTVFFATPTSDEVTEFEEFTGRTAATQVIELQARVSGYLESVNFDDGAVVEKDDVLFKIDDRPFVAEEQRTAAAVSQFEARIKRMTSQLDRARELLGRKAMSQDEFDTVKYDLDEANANLSEAKASHDLAKLNLQFTTVTAPLAGRIGRRMLDAGNLVMADQTMLATIVPQDKVYVYFDMDERTVLKIRRMADPSVVAQGENSNVIVEIALADSPEFSLRGKVDFLDNQIDPATGTLRARATVDNSYNLLSPGLFVRLRYPIGHPSTSLLIPEEAMASDQGRPFVYVVGEVEGQPIAEARTVEPGPLVGSRRVIRSGVNASDRVIVTGLQRLRRNTPITAKEQGTESAGPETKGNSAVSAGDTKKGDS